MPASTSERLSFDEYVAWHAEQFHEDLTIQELRDRFEANSTVLLSAANGNPFMATASASLVGLAEAGVLQGPAASAQLVLVKKPFDSVVNKVYRLNCLWNRKWPAAPKADWVTLDNCYDQLDDIIRGALVCRYLDGPEQVSAIIKAAAESEGLSAVASPRATDAGYYAWHVYVKIPAQVFIGETLAEITASIEVQTTTLLQSALRELTHKLYEVRRQSAEPYRAESRWDYASDQFRAQYLGHTLHLVDAMILELRNAQQPAGEAPSEDGSTASDEETNPE